MKLYEARVRSGDPELQALAIIRPATYPDEVWIIRKEIKIATTEE